MSLPRHRIPPKALALLHDRDITVACLADHSGLSLNRVLRCLTGHPQERREDRRTLLPFVTPGERAALGWAEDVLPVEQSQPQPT